MIHEIIVRELLKKERMLGRAEGGLFVVLIFFIFFLICIFNDGYTVDIIAKYVSKMMKIFE